MKKYKKRKNRSKGGATILVILIVLSIVIFGVANMLTVYTSYKISKKNLDWTKEYYDLDSKAQIFLNKLKKEIGKNGYGKEIDTEGIKQILIQYVDENTTVIVNKKIIKKPLDKIEKIVQNNYINIEAYFRNNKKRTFYVNIKIPEKRGEDDYEIISWRKISETFEYEQPTFEKEGEIEI